MTRHKNTEVTQETFSGYTMEILNSIINLSRYLKMTEKITNQKEN